MGSLHHSPDPFLKNGQTRFEFAVRFILLLPELPEGSHLMPGFDSLLLHAGHT